MKRCHLAASAIAGLLLISTVSAQVRVSIGVYHQDFGGLAVSGSSNPWLDNSTLPGWFAAKTEGGTSVGTYRASTGSDAIGGLHSYGASASAERALGSLASGGVGDLVYAVVFTNDTGQAQTAAQPR